VVRNIDLAYPQSGVGVGIGPIEGNLIPVEEMDFDLG
jgi:hypothetical protein